MKLLNALIIPVVLSMFSAAALADSPRLLATPTPAPPPLTKEVVNDEGEHLIADSFSRTLYVFDPDMGKTTPQCEGACAEQWPPYILTPEEIPTLTSPHGTITRTNGKVQLTYGGRPVYTYAFDRTIGDDKGDGIGGVWHYIEIEPVK